MAMTKKEKAEMMAAIEKAELLAALRWTSPVERDVAPPKEFGSRSEGWTYYSSNRTVLKAWSRRSIHGTGEYVDPKRNHAYEGPLWLFSTKKRALAAMRHEIETKTARELLEIDRMLKEDDE